MDYSCRVKREDALDLTVLVEMASISAGYPFRGRIDQLPGGDVAVIQMRNADPGTGIDWADLSRVELPRASEKAFLRPGDIILSTRGGRNFAYCIDANRGHAVCSPHFFVIRLTRGSVLPEFLAWQINQKPAQNHFAAGATGTHILNLRRAVVEELRVAVPSIAQQHRIVELDEAARTERSVLKRLVENRTNEMSAIARELLAPVPANPHRRAQ